MSNNSPFRGLGGLPNLFTLLNLFFGCIAIVFATQSGLTPMYDNSGMPMVDNAGNQFINIPEKIWMASVFIMLAAVVDFLDGFVARLLKAASDMGKQLDSLSDVVSFGVAPSIIAFQFLRLCFARQEDGLNASMAWLFPAFILACAGAYRLARFNLDPEQSVEFKGLPVPAAGIVIASMPMIYWFSDDPWLLNLLLNLWFWYALIIMLSWLMVSRLPLISLKFKDYSFRNNMPKWVLAAVAVASAVLLKWLAIPVTIAGYIIISLIFKNKS
jgi:CDP-diacylglycerol--serine O-phosphatidyltransferase